MNFSPFTTVGRWLIGCLLAPFFLPAQTASPSAFVSGMLVSSGSEGVAYAAVSLFTEDGFLTGEMTDEAGAFRMDEVPEGTYWLQVQHLEYADLETERFTVSAGRPVEFGAIQLEAAGQNLEEIVVTGRRALVEVRPDRTVFNVAASPLASGTNGLDLLRKSPGVRVGTNNQISLPGKNSVRIYINDVPTELTGQDLATLLQGMSSDNVEAIDIISNPSAKYEAAGDGIINIRTKRNTAIGFKGSVGASFSQGIYHELLTTASLNYGSERVKINFDLTQTDGDYLQAYLDENYQRDARLKMYSSEIYMVSSLQANLGVEFRLSDAHTLNVSTTGVYTDLDTELEGWTEFYTPADGPLEAYLDSGVDYEGPRNRFSGNLSHRWNLDERTSLVTTLSKGGFEKDAYTIQPNRLYGPDRTTLRSVDDNTMHALADIDLQSVKSDFERSWEGISLSLGGKYARIESANDFQFFLLQNGMEQLVPEKSNFFRYVERVGAAYASISTPLGSALTLNAGLRYEHTASRGSLTTEQDVANKEVPRSYGNVFPSVALSFANDGDHLLNLSYGRRITRPNYERLNPFEVPMSSVLIWKGNPFLQPTYTDNLQLTYAFRSKLTVAANYAVSRDYFAELYESTPELVNFRIPYNLERSTSYGLSLSYPLEITKGWDFAAYLDGAHQRNRGEQEGVPLDFDLTYYSVRITNAIQLPGGILFDVSGSYFSKMVVEGVLEVEGNPQLSFGFRRDFFDRRLQVRVTGADVFGTDRVSRYTGDYRGIYIDGQVTYDTQRFGAGFTYHFGNRKAQTDRNADSGLEDELDRL